jgi:hypothetical protein
VKIFFFLLATITSPNTIMDPTNTNLGNQGGAGDDQGGNNERRAGEGDAGSSGGKGKGKGRACTEDLVQFDTEEAALELLAATQRRSKKIARLRAALQAQEEMGCNAQLSVAEFAAALADMESADVSDPQFARDTSPGPTTFYRQFHDRSATPAGPVGNEDEPVSEEDSDRDPNTMYSNEEGADLNRASQ